MTIESQDDIDALRRVGQIVALVLERMLGATETGMMTRKVDAPAGN